MGEVLGCQGVLVPAAAHESEIVLRIQLLNQVAVAHIHCDFSLRVLRQHLGTARGVWPRTKSCLLKQVAFLIENPDG